MKKDEKNGELGYIYFPRAAGEATEEAAEDLEDFPERDGIINLFRDIEVKYQKLPVAYVKKIIKDGKKKIYLIPEKKGLELQDSGKFKHKDPVNFEIKGEWACNIKPIKK